MSLQRWLMPFGSGNNSVFGLKDGLNYLWNNSGNDFVGRYSTSTSYYYSYGNILKKENGVLSGICSFNDVNRDSPRWYSTSYSSYSDGASNIVRDNPYCLNESECVWNDYEAYDIKDGISGLFDGVTEVNYLSCLFRNNTTITELPDLSNITSVGNYGLQYTFSGCTGLTGTPDLSSITSVGSSGLSATFNGCTGLTGTPDLSNITSVGNYGLYYTFNGCTGLTGTPDLSNITSVGNNGLQYTFYGCKNLTGTPKLPNITSIPSSGLYYTFQNCTGLTGTPDLSNITSVGNNGLYYTFYNCTGLTGTPDLSSITSVGSSGLGYTFRGCTGLTGDVYFSSLDPTQVTITGTSYSTNPFYWCFYQCTGIDSVHFPASLTAEQKQYLSKTVLFGGETEEYCKPTCEIFFDCNLTFSYSLSTGSVTHTNHKGESTTYTGSGSLIVNGGEKLVFNDVTPRVEGCTLDTDGTIISSSITGDIKASDSILIEGLNYLWNDSGNAVVGRYNTSTTNYYSYGNILKKENGILSSICSFNDTSRNAPRWYATSGTTPDADGAENIVTANPYCSNTSETVWNNSDVIDVKDGVSGLFEGVTEIQNLILLFARNTNITELPDLSCIRVIGSNGFRGVFSDCTALTGAIDLSNITTVGQYGLRSTFSGCTKLTGTPDLSSITTLDDTGLHQEFDSTFSGCTGLTGTPKIPNITTIPQYGLQCTFQNCTGLTGTPDLSNIIGVSNYGLSQTFSGCTGLTGDVYFSSLDSTKVTITGTSASNNPFYRCFFKCTNIDSIHFPASLTDTQKSYLTKTVLFGGTNSTYCKSTLQILFDL